MSTFVVPSREKPRDCYVADTETFQQIRGWQTHVTVREVASDRVVARYDRNYSMLGTFEPFRQGELDFALISPDYTGTSVLDLQSGRVLAAEPHDASGFCPVGFYVPDWWDVHDGSLRPGHPHWDNAYSWPVGDFGFVWGCIWGDDNSWKLQYLDLSRVQQGEIRRDDRFGYLELATISEDPRDFIRVGWTRESPVTIAALQHYDLSTGEEKPW